MVCSGLEATVLGNTSGSLIKVGTTNQSCHHKLDRVKGFGNNLYSLLTLFRLAIPKLFLMRTDFDFLEVS